MTTASLLRLGLWLVSVSLVCGSTERNLTELPFCAHAPASSAFVRRGHQLLELLLHGSNVTRTKNATLTVTCVSDTCPQDERRVYTMALYENSMVAAEEVNCSDVNATLDIFNPACMDDSPAAPGGGAAAASTASTGGRKLCTRFQMYLRENVLTWAGASFNVSVSEGSFENLYLNALSPGLHWNFTVKEYREFICSAHFQDYSTAVSQMLVLFLSVVVFLRSCVFSQTLQQELASTLPRLVALTGEQVWSAEPVVAPMETCCSFGCGRNNAKDAQRSAAAFAPPRRLRDISVPASETGSSSCCPCPCARSCLTCCRSRSRNNNVQETVQCAAGRPGRPDQLSFVVHSREQQNGDSAGPESLPSDDVWIIHKDFAEDGGVYSAEIEFDHDEAMQSRGVAISMRGTSIATIHERPGDENVAEDGVNDNSRGNSAPASPAMARQRSGAPLNSGEGEAGTMPVLSLVTSEEVPAQGGRARRGGVAASTGGGSSPTKGLGRQLSRRKSSSGSASPVSGRNSGTGAELLTRKPTLNRKHTLNRKSTNGGQAPVSKTMRKSVKNMKEDDVGKTLLKIWRRERTTCSRSMSEYKEVDLSMKAVRAVAFDHGMTPEVKATLQRVSEEVSALTPFSVHLFRSLLSFFKQDQVAIVIATLLVFTLYNSGDTEDVLVVVGSYFLFFLVIRLFASSTASVLSEFDLTNHDVWHAYESLHAKENVRRRFMKRNGDDDHPKHLDLIHFEGCSRFVRERGTSIAIAGSTGLSDKIKSHWNDRTPLSDSAATILMYQLSGKRVFDPESVQIDPDSSLQRFVNVSWNSTPPVVLDPGEDYESDVIEHAVKWIGKMNRPSGLRSGMLIESSQASLFIQVDNLSSDAVESDRGRSPKGRRGSTISFGHFQPLIEQEGTLVEVRLVKSRRGASGPELDILKVGNRGVDDDDTTWKFVSGGQEDENTQKESSCFKWKGSTLQYLFCKLPELIARVLGDPESAPSHQVDVTVKTLLIILIICTGLLLSQISDFLSPGIIFCICGVLTVCVLRRQLWRFTKARCVCCSQDTQRGDILVGKVESIFRDEEDKIKAGGRVDLDNGVWFDNPPDCNPPNQDNVQLQVKVSTESEYGPWIIVDVLIGSQRVPAARLKRACKTLDTALKCQNVNILSNGQVEFCFPGNSEQFCFANPDNMSQCRVVEVLDKEGSVEIQSKVLEVVDKAKAKADKDELDDAQLEVVNAKQVVDSGAANTAEGVEAAKAALSGAEEQVKVIQDKQKGGGDMQSNHRWYFENPEDEGHPDCSFACSLKYIPTVFTTQSVDVTGKRSSVTICFGDWDGDGQCFIPFRDKNGKTSPQIEYNHQLHLKNALPQRLENVEWIVEPALNKSAIKKLTGANKKGVGATKRFEVKCKILQVSPYIDGPVVLEESELFDAELTFPQLKNQPLPNVSKNHCFTCVDVHTSAESGRQMVVAGSDQGQLCFWSLRAVFTKHSEDRSDMFLLGWSAKKNVASIDSSKTIRVRSWTEANDDLDTARFFDPKVDENKRHEKVDGKKRDLHDVLCSPPLIHFASEYHSVRWLNRHPGIAASDVGTDRSLLVGEQYVILPLEDGGDTGISHTPNCHCNNASLFGQVGFLQPIDTSLNDSVTLSLLSANRPIPNAKCIFTDEHVNRIDKTDPGTRPSPILEFVRNEFMVIQLKFVGPHHPMDVKWIGPEPDYDLELGSIQIYVNRIDKEIVHLEILFEKERDALRFENPRHLFPKAVKICAASKRLSCVSNVVHRLPDGAECLKGSLEIKADTICVKTYDTDVFSLHDPQRNFVVCTQDGSGKTKVHVWKDASDENQPHSSIECFVVEKLKDSGAVQEGKCRVKEITHSADFPDGKVVVEKLLSDGKGSDLTWSFEMPISSFRERARLKFMQAEAASAVEGHIWGFECPQAVRIEKETPLDPAVVWYNNRRYAVKWIGEESRGKGPYNLVTVRHVEPGIDSRVTLCDGTQFMNPAHGPVFTWRDREESDITCVHIVPPCSSLNTLFDGDHLVAFGKDDGTLMLWGGKGVKPLQISDRISSSKAHVVKRLWTSKMTANDSQPTLFGAYADGTVRAWSLQSLFTDPNYLLKDDKDDSRRLQKNLILSTKVANGQVWQWPDSFDFNNRPDMPGVFKPGNRVCLQKHKNQYLARHVHLLNVKGLNETESALQMKTGLWHGDSHDEALENATIKSGQKLSEQHKIDWVEHVEATVSKDWDDWIHGDTASDAQKRHCKIDSVKNGRVNVSIPNREGGRHTTSFENPRNNLALSFCVSLHVPTTQKSFMFSQFTCCFRSDLNPGRRDALAHSAILIFAVSVLMLSSFFVCQEHFVVW